MVVVYLRGGSQAEIKGAARVEHESRPERPDLSHTFEALVCYDRSENELGRFDMREVAGWVVDPA